MQSTTLLGELSKHLTRGLLRDGLRVMDVVGQIYIYIYIRLCGARRWICVLLPRGTFGEGVVFGMRARLLLDSFEEDKCLFRNEDWMRDIDMPISSHYHQR